MQNIFLHFEVDHLPRTGLDHASLVLSCEDRRIRSRNSFRFLKFLTKHASFKDVIRQQPDTDCSSDSFLNFKIKIKHATSTLTPWSTKTFGDIF